MTTAKRVRFFKHLWRTGLSLGPDQFGILSAFLESQTTESRGAQQAVAELSAVGVQHVSSGAMDHNVSSTLSS